MGQKWTRVLLFSWKPLDTNMVLCCTEKLCVGTDTAPQDAHPLYRPSTASKQKIYQSEKRKVILDKQQVLFAPDQFNDEWFYQAYSVLPPPASPARGLWPAVAP